MSNVILPVHVESLDEGGYLAICDVIQGCHAEGETVAEALEMIEDVAQILLELQREEGLPLDPMFATLEVSGVVRAELIDLDHD